MEQKVKRNDVELEEEEFWEKELIQIEQENTKQLKDQLQEREKNRLCKSEKGRLSQAQTVERRLKAENCNRTPGAQLTGLQGKVGKVTGETDRPASRRPDGGKVTE